MSKYNVEIKQIGENAAAMLEEQMLILFNEQAPSELRDFCIVTSSGQVNEQVKAGDQLILGGNPFKVTAVGSVANENLANLGHVTLCFDGATEAKLPGHIHLDSELSDLASLKGNIEIK